MEVEIFSYLFRNIRFKAISEKADFSKELQTFGVEIALENYIIFDNSFSIPFPFRSAATNEQTSKTSK